MGTKDFDGKVAIVTGGASGIGAALSRALASHGADVVIADRQADLAGDVAAKVRADGGKAHAAEVDVRQLASMTRIVSDTVARAGRVDLFFNNAGIGVGGEVESYSPRDWDDVFDVNLRGVAYGIQAVYPVMIRQGSGHIVNTASVAGLVAAPMNGSYCATKHAVVGLSKSLRIEAAWHGVKVSVLCPGAIDTPILSGGKYGRINTPGLSERAARKLWDPTFPMNADTFAGKVLRAVAKNEAIIVVPAWWKAFWYLDRISPAVSAQVWGLVAKRLRSEVAAAASAPPVTTRAANGADARPN